MNGSVLNPYSYLGKRQTQRHREHQKKKKKKCSDWQKERLTVVDRIGIHVCLDHPHLQLGTCICVSSWGWLFYFYWGFFKTTTEDDAALLIIYLQLPLLLFLLLDTSKSTTVFLPRITRTWAGIHSVSMAWWHMHCGVDVDIILKVGMNGISNSPPFACLDVFGGIFFSLISIKLSNSLCSFVWAVGGFSDVTDIVGCGRRRGRRRRRIVPVFHVLVLLFAWLLRSVFSSFNNFGHASVNTPWMKGNVYQCGG